MNVWNREYEFVKNSLTVFLSKKIFQKNLSKNLNDSSFSKIIKKGIQIIITRVIIITDKEVR